MTTIYFATNREHLSDDDKIFGSHFSQDGLANLRFGRAELEGEDFDDVSIQVAPENLFDSEPPVLGSRAIFSEVRQQMQQEAQDTLLFIHGFNVSFKEALKSAAQLHRVLTTPSQNSEAPLKLNMCVFSWPSDGEMLLASRRAQNKVAYQNDRIDARASGAAFARGFLKVADFIQHTDPEGRCQQRIHLLAHSMGNYVLRYALQDLRGFVGNQLPRLFDQILMMAADEDDDAFDLAHKLELLPRITRRTNVYFNREDLALWASDRIKGNPPRLGSDGPLHPHSLPRNVYPIDCTDIISKLTEPSEHGYFIKVERVVQDIRQVLAGAIPDEIPGRRYISETKRYRLLQDATHRQER